jgi:hypothetical protein
MRILCFCRIEGHDDSTAPGQGAAPVRVALHGDSGSVDHQGDDAECGKSAKCIGHNRRTRPAQQIPDTPAPVASNTPTHALSANEVMREFFSQL